MSAAFDQVSTINYQEPFFGGTRDWAGKSERAIVASSSAVINSFKALLDPAQKERVQMEQAGVNAVVGGVKAVFGAVGDATSAAAKAAGTVILPLISGFRWLVVLAVAVAVVYALSIARPLIPGGR